MEQSFVENDKGDSIYVSVNLEEVTPPNFDSGATSATVYYYDGEPRDAKVILELKIQLSEEFIEDTYNSPITKKVQARAYLDVGIRAYKEKNGRLSDIETVVGLSKNSRLRYIPKIDMKHVN